MSDVKPSDMLKKSTLDGKVVKDKLGRSIVLRKPNTIDKYYLVKALGEDSKNPMCVAMMFPLLYVAKLDGEVFPPITGYRECIAGLKRLEEEGVSAINVAIEEDSTVESEIENIKK